MISEGLATGCLPLVVDKLAINSSNSLVAFEAAGVLDVDISEEMSSVSPGNPVSVLVSFTVMVTFWGPVYMTSPASKLSRRLSTVGRFETLWALEGLECGLFPPDPLKELF